MITSEKAIAINHPPAFMATTILKINNEQPVIKEVDDEPSFIERLLYYIFDFVRDIFVY